MPGDRGIYDVNVGWMYIALKIYDKSGIEKRFPEQWLKYIKENLHVPARIVKAPRCDKNTDGGINEWQK